MAEPIEVILWDCDGVLVDSEPLAARVLAEMLTERGAPHTPEDCYARYTGISMTSVMAKVNADCGIILPEDFEARIRARDDQVFRHELKAIEGVAETVAALPLRHGVASSGSPEKIARSLSLTGLTDLFTPYLYSAAMVENGKPAPDLFLYAARRMNVDPTRCLVIEDSLSGIRAGRAAGMRVFGFCGGGHCDADYGRKLRNTGAQRVFDHMSQLPALMPK
ncbi:HAD family phosphatase [Magnetospira sp. QH-2]|uniref:HAD family hydrolase n=1 Tax=Magnetospira sp. (strain QH-2) TaxID=1288970 RepID=UPI0003E817CB|nr:HAD family hydrolase [Magnetospira sp. QH-2]CCQ72056.1 phosphatase [Magnetospira sp. QH-2]